MRRAKRTAKRTIVILSLALAGCGGPVTLPATVTPQVVPVRILATTAAYPLLQDVVTGYRAPQTLLAVDSAVVNWATIQARLLAGTDSTGTGLAGTDPTWYALTTFLPSNVPTDRGWWVAPVARDGIAIIVHPTNPVGALTVDELRLLVAGEIASWRDVGGPDLPVIVVSREAGADTQLAFDDQVLRGRLPPGTARLALSSARMVEIVAQTPGAIGYVSMGWLGDQADQFGVRVIPLAHDADSVPVVPTPVTVSAENYPLHTTVVLVGLSPPANGSAVYAWFAWIQSDTGQQVATRRYGALSLHSEMY